MPPPSSDSTVHEVTITFRVHAPKANNRDRVWLLGSIHELGDWNPALAMETGQVEGEWKVFQANVALPVECKFEWSWCCIAKEGQVSEWESPKRRQREISLYSGVLHTSWGDPSLEIFEQNMASAQLMTKKRVKSADVMAVIGSSPPLGSWDPSRAVIATEFPPRSGNWSVHVYFDAASLQEWNWVIIDKATKEVKLAEKRTTRFLREHHDWVKLEAPWNKEAAMVDWSPKEESGDIRLGTAELLRQRKERLQEIRNWEMRAEFMRSEVVRAEERIKMAPQLTRGTPPAAGPVASDARLPTAPPASSPDFMPVLKVKPYFDLERSATPMMTTPPRQSPTYYPPAAVPQRARPIITATMQESNPAFQVRPPSEGGALRSDRRVSISMDASAESAIKFSPPRPPARETEPSIASGNVDMTKVGYSRDLQYTPKGRQNLVSDPGKPGFQKESDTYPGAGTRVSAPTIDTGDLHCRHDHADPSGMELRYMRESLSSVPPISPPVRRVKGDRSTEPDRATVRTAGSSTSLGSTVGLLGVCDINRKSPSIESLRHLSEQREQARATERMKGLIEREERNKTKFENKKQFAFMAPTGKDSPDNRSRPPTPDTATTTATTTAPQPKPDTGDKK